MIITYQGLGAVKIATNKINLLIDPFSPEAGLKPVRGKFDLVLLSHYEKDLPSGIMNTPFVIDTPGEYDYKNITVLGNDHQGNIIYRLNSEGINLIHLSKISNNLTDQEIADLGDDIDVLFIPVGGNKMLDNNDASKLISKIEPNLVIPIYYALPKLKEKLDPLTKFTDEMGVKGKKSEEKINLKQRDVDTDKTEIRILSAGNKL